MVKVTFDGANKLIIGNTLETEHDVQIDYYSDWKEWSMIGDNAKYLQAMRSIGGDPISPIQTAGDTYFIMNGWKIKPPEEDIIITVVGNLYVDEPETYGDNRWVLPDGNFRVGFEFNVSNLVDSSIAQSSELQHSSFNGVVTVDALNGGVGTNYPLGNREFPVNNISDARTIAESRGFHILYIIGNITLGAGDDISEFTLEGQSSTKTTITIGDLAFTSNSFFKNCTVTGIFDDAANFELCRLIDIQFVQGYIFNCVLGGTITLSGVGQTGIYDSWDGKVGLGTSTYPVINFNGSGRSLIVRNYAGDLKMTNKTGLDVVEMDQVSGIVEIDNTVTAGTIILRGTIDVINNSTGTTLVDTSQVVFPEYIQLAAFGNMIHISPIGGVDGTAFPIGTEQHPVRTIEDAILISQRILIENFHVYNSNIPLVIPSLVDISGYAFYGANPIGSIASLTDGCITDKTQFYNMIVTGTINGSVYMQSVGLQSISNIGSDTFPSLFRECIFREGTHSFRNDLVTPQNCHFIDCVSGVPGQGTSILDINSSGTPVAFRRYGGGITIANHTGGQDSTFEITEGQIVFEASCTGGTARLGGMMKVTDNSTGTFTIENRAVFNPTYLANYVWDEIIVGGNHNTKNSAAKRLVDIASNVIHTALAQGPGINGNQIQLALTAADYDGAYDPAEVSIVEGTGIGQNRLILQYSGSDRMATVDRDWKIEPDNESEYQIVSSAGRETVNEGLARGGTLYTITLNALASSVDDSYKYQSVFIRSGTGQDQVGHISSYDGTTKIATLGHSWLTIPDTTSGYALLPTHLNPKGLAEHVWNTDISGTEYESDTTKAGTLLNQLNLSLTSKLVVDETTSKLIIYKRDGVTPAFEWVLQDKNGSNIVLQGTGPVDRAILNYLG